MNKNQLTGKGVPEAVDHYQNIKTEKDLRAYCRSRNLPVYTLNVLERYIVNRFALVPENFSAKKISMAANGSSEENNRECWKKQKNIAQSIDLVLIDELEENMKDVSGFVRYKSSWGDTWTRVEQGERIEEFNLLEGRVYRYWHHKSGERRAEFSFDGDQDFPYTFTATPELEGKERSLV